MMCGHCYQPMLHVPCDDCDGYGGLWVEATHYNSRWQSCVTCHDTGKVWRCANTRCPGIVWYPLSRADSATLRTVIQRIEREEAK